MAEGVLSAEDALALGGRIRELRRTRRLSQLQLSLAVGVTLRTVQHWEAGWSSQARTDPINPQLSNLAALARALDVRVDIRYVGEQLHVELVSED